MRRKRIRVKVMGTVILAALLGINPCITSMAGQRTVRLKDSFDHGLSYKISRSNLIYHTSDLGGGTSDGGNGGGGSGSGSSGDGSGSGSSGGGSGSGSSGDSSGSGSSGGGSGSGSSGDGSGSGSSGDSSGSGSSEGDSGSGSSGDGSGSGSSEGGSGSGSSGDGSGSGSVGDGSGSGSSGDSSGSGSSGDGSGSGNSGDSSGSGSSGDSSGSGSSGDGSGSGNSGDGSGSENTGGGPDSGNSGDGSGSGSAEGGPDGGNSGGGSGSGSSGDGSDGGSSVDSSGSENTGGGSGSGSTGDGSSGGTVGGSHGGEQGPGIQQEPIKSPEGLITGQLKSQYFEGEGLEEQPYLIHSSKDLAMLSHLVEEQYEEYGGCYYRLSGNIALKRPEGKRKSSAKSNCIPIGSEEHPFYGTFDGNGYVIKNLCINEPEKDNQGLFGVISESGIVCSVGVTGSVVCGLNNTGALAGTNRGTVDSCFQSGEVYGLADGTGGIAGRNQGEVVNCYNSGDVNSGYQLGDIIPRQGGYGEENDQAPSGLWEYVQTIAETIVETIAETLEETREAILETIDRVTAAAQPEESPVPEESSGQDNGNQDIGNQDIGNQEDTLEAAPDIESSEAQENEVTQTDISGAASSEDEIESESDQAASESEAPDSAVTTEEAPPQEEAEQYDSTLPLAVIEEPFVPLGSIETATPLSAADPMVLTENPETDGTESETSETPPTLQTMQAVNPATGEGLETEEGPGAFEDQETEHKAVYAMGGLVGLNAGGVVRDSYQIGRLSAVNREWAIGGVAGWSENGLLENCFYLEGTARLALPGEETNDPTALEEMSGETALGVMGLDPEVWEARESVADREEHSEAETLGETGPGVKVEPAEETTLRPPGPIRSGNRDEWTGPGAVASQETETAPEAAGSGSTAPEAAGSGSIAPEVAGSGSIVPEAAESGSTATGAAESGTTAPEAVESAPMDSEMENGIVVYRYYFPQPKIFRQRGQEQPYTLGFFEGGGLRVDNLRKTASVFSSKGFLWLFSTSDYLDYRITLEDDLDLTGMLTSIGTADQPFTGSLEGNGYKISGLRVPLFGVLGDGARVSNLLLDSAEIHEAVVYRYAEGEEPGTVRTELQEGENGTMAAGCGILAAYAQNALIYNCAAVGNINLLHVDYRAAEVQAGGLIGKITVGTSVSNSYAFVTLTAEPEVGISTYAGGLIGIVGRDAGAINCYATGLVQTTGTAGGFAAENYGEIDQCYVSNTISDKAKKAGAFVAYMPEQRPEDIIDMEALQTEWREQKTREAAEKEEKRSDKTETEAQTQKNEAVSEQSRPSVPADGMGESPNGGLWEDLPESKPENPTETANGTAQDSQPESREEKPLESKAEKPADNKAGNPTEGKAENPADNKAGNLTEGKAENLADNRAGNPTEYRAESRTAAGLEHKAAEAMIGYAGSQRRGSRNGYAMALASTGLGRIIGRSFDISGSVIRSGWEAIQNENFGLHSIKAALILPEPAVSETPPAPTAPTVSETPSAPSGSETPPAPTVSETPPAPTASETPPAPAVSETPSAPSGSETPPAPAVSETPSAPAVSETPSASETSSAPTAPETPPASAADSTQSTMGDGASASAERKTGVPAWIAQNRSINDCFYDRQMSGIEDEYALGLDTEQMTGTNVELPGVWHLTEGAYPQLHTMLTEDVSEDFGIYSRASVIALFLPEGMSLEDAIKHAYVEQKTPLVLPLVSDIDGEQIQWDVNGKVTKKEDTIILGE